GDKVCNLLHLRNAAHGDRGRRKLVGFLVGDLHVARHGLDQPGPALGPYRPGIDRHEADAVLAVLPGKRQREVLPRGIRCSRTDFPVGGFYTVIADQIHDAAAALFHHDRQHIAQAAYVAHELELETLLPVVLAQVLDDAAGCGAGIVDHDVDAPERLVALLDEVPGIGIFAQIGRNGDDLASGG